MMIILNALAPFHGGGGGGGGHKTLSAHGMRSNNIKNIFKSWLRGIKKEFMLNSAEHEFFPVH